MTRRASFSLLTRYQRSPSRLREAMEHDPRLRAEAEEELKALVGIDDERCVVTKEYREALKEALR